MTTAVMSDVCNMTFYSLYLIQNCGCGQYSQEMEWTLATFGMNRFRLLYWQKTHARSTGELVATARRLGRAAEALEIEIKQTEEDIRKAHKTSKHSRARKRPLA